MVKDMIARITSNGQMLAWMTGISVVMFVTTLLLIPVLVVRIPEDYFRREGGYDEELRRNRPFLYWSVLLLKNLLGVVFILAGLAMLFLPGQGILSILIGVSFTDFPGKRRLERRLVSVPKVLHSINWMRSRSGKSPLLPPFLEDGGSEPGKSDGQSEPE